MEKEVRIFKKDNKIYRKVKDIEEMEKLIDVFRVCEFFPDKIVDTKVFDRGENLLESDFIPVMIHSGEFTTSMAFDLVEQSIDMTLKLVSNGVYPFDLVPHNFTYSGANWIFYDFDSFSLTPKLLKAQIRSLFKVPFCSFELLRLIKRKDLQHYFLNRVSHSDIAKMLPFKNFMLWSINLAFCLFLHKFGLNKLAIKCLQNQFKKYKKLIYSGATSFSILEKDNITSNIVDKVLAENNVKSVFAITEKSAQWSVLSTSSARKFVYLDDYNVCDDFYKYINKNSCKTISTAVIYPFMQEREISKNTAYRGIYDYFAKERFNSDAVVVMDTKELYPNNDFDIESFCKNIVEFSTNIYLQCFDNVDEKKLADEICVEMKKYYNEVGFVETDEKLVLFAKGKKVPLPDFSKFPPYNNSNRAAEAKLQSKAIIDLIKNV